MSNTLKACDRHREALPVQIIACEECIACLKQTLALARQGSSYRLLACDSLRAQLERRAEAMTAVEQERDALRAQLAAKDAEIEILTSRTKRLSDLEPVAEAVRRRVREAEEAAGEPLYFIQDACTWHGDMIVFWGPNGNGYVVDIMQAGLYPASHSRGSRDSDHYWRPEDLLGTLTTCANSERLRGQKAQKKPLKQPERFHGTGGGR